MSNDLIQNLKVTGFCWRCGRECERLFCSAKHQNQWERKQESGVIKGKRASYGARGSTH